MILLIQTDSVQKGLAKRATRYLSERLNTPVTVNSVHIKFFKKIEFEGIYIEDLHHDTILYAKKVKVKVDKIDLENHKIYFDAIELVNAKSKIIKYENEEKLNLQFIINSFKSDKKKSTERVYWDIRFDEVKLVNTDFSYRNEHKNYETTGINYFDLRATSVNGKFRDVIIDHDTITGQINYLSATEKSGFILQNFVSLVKVSPVGVQLDKLKIRTPYSFISTDLTFDYAQYTDFYDFNHLVYLKGNFDQSEVELKDISYFAPALRGISKKIIVSGAVSGTVSDLRGKKIKISMDGRRTEFKGSVKLKGLPKIKETAIYLTVNQLKTNYHDLQEIPIPPFTSYKKLNVPDNVEQLGAINFKGTFVGFINDFYTYGKLTSDLGDLSSDLSLSYDEKLQKQVYRGKLKSLDFDFGRYFGVPTLGNVSGNVDVEGSGVTLDELSANLNGTITTLKFKNYPYENIHVEGDIAKKIFNGKFSVNDDNIDFDFNGNVDFTRQHPQLDFVTTINRANLSALHIVDSAKKTNFSTHVNIDVTGNNIDNLNGEINFTNTNYTQDGEIFNLKAFNLVANNKEGSKSLSVKSDFIDGKVQGEFTILDLPSSFKSFVGKYLPSLALEKENSIKPSVQNFNYQFVLKETDPVTRLLFSQLKVAPQTKIQGDYNSTTNRMSVTGNSSEVIYDKMIFDNWYLKSNSDSEFEITIGSDQLHLNNKVWLGDFSFNSSAVSDSVSYSVAWDNKSNKESRGEINALMYFHSIKKFDFELFPSEFVIADSVWTVGKGGEIHVDTTHISVSDFVLEKGSQTVSVKGVVSENIKDRINFDFNNFNLANFNVYTKSLSLELRGTLSGESSISDVYGNPLFVSSNRFDSLYVNGNKLGDGSIESVWNNPKQALYMHGAFSLGIVPNVLFSGNYYPKRKTNSLDMELSFQAIQLLMFKPFVKKYCSDFSGSVAGNVSILGSLKEPKLSGAVNVNARAIRIDYLNTVYNFSSSIGVSNNSFDFDNVVVYDINHNKADVNGKIYHDNFKNFQLDLDLQTNKFNCLNTKESDNSLYYGKAFVSGIVSFSGYTKNVLIEANVKSESVLSDPNAMKINPLSKTEITKLFIPITSTGELKSNSFIRFVQKDSVVEFKNDYKVNLGGIKLDFNVELTPDAEIQLIFDQQVGDIIKTKGRGNIKLNIDTKGEFKMYGDYFIESGDYLFTLKNFFNKKFDIERGSTIKWNGNPYEADLNLNTIYKARASLAPVTDTSINRNFDAKKRYPVDVKLLMTKSLLEPDIEFDIDLPTVDPSTRREVLSYINNEAEMNHQVFSLLILNSFVRPVQNVGAAASANTSELLSNQLSNMLRKISNDFDVGINYLPGDDISKDELEVALSTQLFNNKLSIDGNLGVSENNQTTNNIVGDVNVDYKLTDDGKLRIKAFNKSNDITNQVILNGPYTQGVGVFYREEFNTLGELYRRYLEKLKN